MELKALSSAALPGSDNRVSVSENWAMGEDLREREILGALL